MCDQQQINELLEKERRKYKLAKRKTVRPTKKTRQKVKNDLKEKALNDAQSSSNTTVGNTSNNSVIDLIGDDEGNNIPFPQITEENWNRFKNRIFNNSSDDIDTQICLMRMQHHSQEFHFSALYFVRRSITDSLLKRDWDTLLKLLLILIERYCHAMFAPLIRNICEILKTFHPQIRGTVHEEEFNLILEKYKDERNKVKNKLKIK